MKQAVTTASTAWGSAGAEYERFSEHFADV